MLDPNSLLLRQVAKFGVSGVAATIIHLSLVSLLVEVFESNPQVANVFAFSIAFFFSFFMNYYWTFKMAETKEARSALLKRCVRFFLVALVGLGVNIFWVYLCTVVFAKEYYYSYPLIVMLTPVVTFSFSKLFVFKKAQVDRRRI